VPGTGTFRPFCEGRALAYCSTAVAGASLWSDGRRRFPGAAQFDLSLPPFYTPKLDANQAFIALTALSSP